MKAKIFLLLFFLAMATLPAQADRQKRQERQNSPKKVNNRNKKNLKKWGLGEVIRWEEVAHAG